LPNSLSNTNFSKSGSFVQRDAGAIFWKDSRLQGPDPILLRLIDEGAE
jgi:hypothetical protein